MELKPAEHARLADLYEFDILDTGAEAEFNDIVELASQLAGVPISLISLIDLNRQWIKARVGFDAGETPREVAFCDHAIRQDEPLVVEDAREDLRFANNPMVVNDPNLRFYAGFPLVTASGSKIGTLCVLDQKPNRLQPLQLEALAKLARQVIHLFELRVKNGRLERMTAKLEQQKGQLDILLANQRRIISVLAHDTRGPLGAIHQLLETPGVRDEQASGELLDLIAPQIGATVQVVDSLINWGLVHLAGKNHESYDLRMAVDEALEPLRKRAAEKQVALQIQVDPGVELPLHRDMLCFVVRNLAQNAIKYTEKGRVDIEIGLHGPEPRLTVHDNGIGMPAAVRDRLFHQRVGSRQGTQSETGSGIGLLLIHDFVQQQGGTITVQSAPGEGTEVCLSSSPQKA